MPQLLPLRKRGFVNKDYKQITSQIGPLLSIFPQTLFVNCERWPTKPCITKDLKTGRFALLNLALGINELGKRLAGLESEYNGLVDSFLISCGGIESVAGHPKTRT